MGSNKIRRGTSPPRSSPTGFRFPLGGGPPATPPIMRRKMLRIFSGDFYPARRPGLPRVCRQTGFPDKSCQNFTAPRLLVGDKGGKCNDRRKAPGHAWQ
jgi:hypothetical protein